MKKPIICIVSIIFFTALPYTSMAFDPLNPIPDTITGGSVKDSDDVRELFESHCDGSMTVQAEDSGFRYTCDDFDDLSNSELLKVSYHTDTFGALTEHEMVFETDRNSFPGLYNEISQYYRLIRSEGETRFFFERSIELIKDGTATLVRIRDYD